MERYRLPNPQASISSNSSQHAKTPIKNWLYQVLPGVGLCSGLALVASFLHTLPQLRSLSSMILAIALGIVIRNAIGVASVYEKGIRFALRRILRVAIALLGLQFSFVQIANVGSTGLAIVVITLFSTFWFTCWLGKQLGIRQSLTHLIAAGTAICGASAVMATNAVNHSSDEDAAYAVATVTVFGTVSMFLYPMISSVLHLAPQTFGIWCGASIHEVAQVIAAAFQAGTVSGQLATITKLSRVLLLAPTIIALGIVSQQSHQSSYRKSQRLPLPWFIFSFIVLTVLNSLDAIPVPEKNVLIMANQFLMTTAIAAMGLETKLQAILKSGLKPFYLAAAAWIFISVTSFMMIKMFYE